MRKFTSAFMNSQRTVDANSLEKGTIPNRFSDLLEEPNTILALSKKAKEGNADAQYSLAKMYAGNEIAGNEYNYQEAATWYAKAANQGNADAQYALGEIYSSCTIDQITRDYNEAAKWYSKAAEQDHIESTLKLGFLYARGLGVPKDMTKAIQCFDVVASSSLVDLFFYYPIRPDNPLLNVDFDLAFENAKWAENAYYQGIVGYKYLKGLGVEKNCAKAVELISISAKNSDSTAQLTLGLMYHKGECVSRNMKLAFDWLLQASRRGEKRATYCLGWMHYGGQGVEKNREEAVRWFVDSDKQQELGLYKVSGDFRYEGWAKQENYKEALKYYLLYANALNEPFFHTELFDANETSAVLYRLGQMYHNGEGTLKDSEAAIKWYTTAGELGNKDAQFALGWLYSNGEDVVEDDRRASEWYSKAAEQDDIAAQFNLAGMYARGEGVPQDYEKAVQWLTIAAEKGLSTAQSSLGLMYAKGQGGKQDYKEAVKWFAKAAEQGDATAQFNMGISYSNGKGVIEDYVEAYKWILLAGMNGCDVSNTKLWLQYRMTTDQIAEAQLLAKEFAGRNSKNEDRTSTDNDENSTTAFGTGFFISKDGLFLTAAHVIDNASLVQLYWNSKVYEAETTFIDETLDIAVLKATGVQLQQVLSLANSSTVKTGDRVFTLGFPQVQLQGVEPKYTDGSISSLSGVANDSKYFQISVPVQPGNSGGPLLDSQGRVIGLINSRLDDINTLMQTGAIPQNVNYALKSSFILTLLETLPNIMDRLDKLELLDTSTAIERSKSAVGLVICTN